MPIKKMEVEAIKNGSVIDHIPVSKGLKILKFFKFAQGGDKITIGLNLSSGNSKKKDLIKVEDVFLTDEQANQLSLFAPNSTISIIKDFNVINKFKVSFPERIVGILLCPNSNCISQNEPVKTHFYVTKMIPVTLKCHYCEKIFLSSIFPELT